MSFFSKYPNKIELIPYNSYHIAAIVFFITALVLTIIFRKRLRESKYEKTLRYTLITLVIIFEVLYKYWFISTKQGRVVDDALSLDLCAITLYLGCFLMGMKKQWMFSICYFYSLGAMFSMMIPDMGGFGPNHFRYYHFFYIHTFIICTPIYFIVVHDYKIRFKDYLLGLGSIFPIGLFVMGVDFLTKTNYMFLREKPNLASPLDLFGEWPNYIIGMAIMVVVFMTLWYLPWFFINRRKKKREEIVTQQEKIAA